MTETTLVIKWIAPESDGGSPLTEYLVERKEVSKKAWQKVGNVDGQTTHIEAAGLKKGTSYTFRITATNQLGYGSASQHAQHAVDDTRYDVANSFKF